MPATDAEVMVVLVCPSLNWPPALTVTVRLAGTVIVWLMPP